MDILWSVLFAVLLIGYFALEGANIGLGMLLPVLGRTQEGRDRIVAAAAPFVLAGEVWLVAVAGTLFGVYPQAEGEVLFGLYPLVVCLLVSWIVRDAGLWFRRRADGPAWRAGWDRMICLGSWGLALSWGAALTALATGLSITPAALAGAAALAALLAFHGRAFASWLLPGGTAGTAGAAGELSGAAPGGAAGPAVRPAAGRLPGPAASAGRGAAALAVSACLAAAPAAALLAGAAPWLLEHTAPADTLNVLSLMILPCAPLMAGAQVWVWRTFGPRRAADRFPSFF
ncbi:cytochrome BD ubiquinol oxidase subunit II [Planomonospora sphaerica]|uniref:Cytochrome BD ubiquinol oxidase subunit II n=1 Tax=Planomonospora sphaerica TaxID=161355 RepID=A0A171B0X5_9ACTN|nr:cytochrome d ubiquinol oxidase subunit II [Planomonospora sphaerica]GAT64545.1 cytochrome BD ubiquinol oxidase subunit II [Planomonospora sphaerica]